MMFLSVFLFLSFFFFKQKTEYEVRISDGSSDVCSSDLGRERRDNGAEERDVWIRAEAADERERMGRRERRENRLDGVERVVVRARIDERAEERRDELDGDSLVLEEMAPEG